MNLLVTSYCDIVRTNAHINHFKYCDKHNYDYIYDIAPTNRPMFYGKIEKILKLLKFSDWIFWLDDDAYFIDFEIKLADILTSHAEDNELLFCKSPLIDEDFTILSSGNFFLKNTPRIIDFLERCLNTPLDVVKEWWDEKKYGIFTNGDLDLMVYQLYAGVYDDPPQTKIIDYHYFNSRKFHYPDESPFLVHFTGRKKFLQVKAFAKQHRLQVDLSPDSENPSINCRHYASVQLTNRKLFNFLQFLGLFPKE